MDQLKKGRMNPTVQKFYLTCKSWDLTLVKYDSGKVFFFISPSCLWNYFDMADGDQLQ